MSADDTEPSTPEDLELQRRIVNYLSSLNRPGFNRLEVTVKGGCAVIRGNVGTYHLKQLATHGCQRVAGVLKVENAIEVGKYVCQEDTRQQ